VRDSADAFGPLKSVAGGLCFILENCEVWTSLPFMLSDAYRMPQRMKANTASDRIVGTPGQTLAELLCAPVSEGDIKETIKEKDLER
jgi:hypothetical protein